MENKCILGDRSDKAFNDFIYFSLLVCEKSFIKHNLSYWVKESILTAN
jgi:hypothetical protein